MGFLDNLMPDRETLKFNFQEIDINANCQTCFERVDEGKFFPSTRLLVWVCSSGHKSYIEDWKY